MGSFRWLISHASYRPDCYMYTGDGPAPVRGALRLSAQPPGLAPGQRVARRGAG
jgi:hypothetical protein